VNPGFLQRRPLLALAGLLVIYVILALAVSVIVPIGESPDELDHFAYMQYLLREREFPVMAPDAAENETMEANQPPLYYLLGAAVTAWLPRQEPLDLPLNSCFSNELQDQGRPTFYVHSRSEAFPYSGAVLAFHLVRGLSILLGAVTIGLTYWLGRLLLPGKPEAAWLGAAFLALNPQFIYITASINNDGLTTLLGAAVVVLGVVALNRPGGKTAAGLGLLVGLGLLTKVALLALWPVALLAVGWPLIKQFLERRSLKGEGWGAALLVLGLPVLTAGWWYWRAQQLYGDPLVWDVHLQAKGLSIVRTTPLAWVDVLEFIHLHFRSYHALFGWLNIQVPGWMYLFFLLVVVVGLVGLSALLVKAIPQLRRRETALPIVEGVNLPGLLLVLFSAAAIYLSLLRYIQTINWSGYQGRLAYGVAASIAVLLALGWHQAGRWIASRRKGSSAERVLFLPAAVLGVLTFTSLFFVLRPAYPRPTIYQSPTNILETCPQFEEGLQIEGYDAPDTVQPGATVPITLYGYGLADASEPQRVEAQLIGRDGRIVAQSAADLIWQAGQVISTTLLLPVAADSQPAGAVLQVAVQEPGGGWQTAVNDVGRVLDIPIGLQTVKIAPSEPFVANPQRIVQASFGGQLSLIGFDFNNQGGTADITLYWQSLAPMSSDYTTYIHLLDGEGQLVAQADSQPQDGGYPTAVWDVGEIVADAKTVTWTADSASGPYTFWVGAYSLPAVEPLPLDNDIPSDTNFSLPNALLLLTCPDLDSCE
jgi:hypothetical protein